MTIVLRYVLDMGPDTALDLKCLTYKTLFLVVLLSRIFSYLVSSVILYLQLSGIFSHLVSAVILYLQLSCIFSYLVSSVISYLQLSRIFRGGNTSEVTLQLSPLHKFSLLQSQQQNQRLQNCYHGAQR